MLDQQESLARIDARWIRRFRLPPSSSAHRHSSTQNALAKLSTATYFTGSGDYAMTRTFTGKRVGNCPAAATDSKTGKAKS